MKILDWDYPFHTSVFDGWKAPSLFSVGTSCQNPLRF